MFSFFAFISFVGCIISFISTISNGTDSTLWISCLASTVLFGCLNTLADRSKKNEEDIALIKHKLGMSVSSSQKKPDNSNDILQGNNEH